MRVYVVITNGNEVKGEVEGVYLRLEDAENKYRSIIEDWETWAKDDEVEIDEDEDHRFYCMTNFNQYENLEAKIEAVDVE